MRIYDNAKGPSTICDASLHFANKMYNTICDGFNNICDISNTNLKLTQEPITLFLSLFLDVQCFFYKTSRRCILLFCEQILNQ